MSTFKCDTIVDLSRETAGTTPNSIGAEYLVEGTAKAWTKSNDDTGTQQSSFGSSSFTDAGIGDHRITMSNAMVDSDYVIHCSGGDTATSGVNFGNSFSSGVGVVPTTTVFSIISINTSGAAFTGLALYGSAFGDLA